MTHFARFFQCFRRPDLCPFGNNNNNSNKIIIGTVLGAFVLHYLLILWYLSKTDIVPFSDEVTDDQAIKEIHTRRMGALDYWDYSPNLAHFTAG